MSRIILNEDYIVAFFSNNFIDKDHIINNMVQNMHSLKAPLPTVRWKPNKFSVGNHLTLGGEECDGTKASIKEYEVKGTLGEVEGVDLDSVIVKQVDGDPSVIYSLTKKECKELNIQFEEGLHLMPKGLDWALKEHKQEENKNEEPKVEEPIAEENEFLYSPDRLYTYPKDFRSGTIMHIQVKLHGFKVRNSPSGVTKILTPNSDYFPLEKFYHSLKVQNKRALMMGSSSRIPPMMHIPFRFITREVTNGKSDFVDSKGNIYLELSFWGQGLNPTKENLPNDFNYNFAVSYEI